jgi:beta-N-acetylhexosaminidase
VNFSVTTPHGRVTLTPEQLAGQRVIYSYGGLTPPPSLLQLIREGQAAGVAFSTDNISSLSQIKAVVAELEQAANGSENPVRAPLLLMTDQEGGSIRRLPGQPLLSEKQIGASADPAQEATKAGTGAGLNLAGVGINVNLAPVLDAFRMSGDFDDHNGRSYSMDPSVVSALGADFIKTQQQTGVAATAKHFPGLGAATLTQNTDLRPVTLDVPLAFLRAIDELPYKAAISAGVRLVMVSWAVYPALSPRPAGFSSIVVVRELRDRLGFKGVTITDALNAGALEAYGSFGHRAVLAAGAGMDLMLCSGDSLPMGTQAKDGLSAALLDGSLSSANFQRSAQRVVDLRFSLGG